MHTLPEPIKELIRDNIHEDYAEDLIYRYELETSGGITIEDIIAYFEGEGLPIPSPDVLDQLFEDIDQGYDFSGSGLHGWELIDWAVSNYHNT